MRTIKQASNNGLTLKTVHRVIEFNQKIQLKPYIDMNTELRKQANNNSEKHLLKLMNNSVFRKTSNLHQLKKEEASVRLSNNKMALK